MSNYGLIVRNADHEIQIDSTYRNLSLDQEGTTSVSHSNTRTGYYHKLYISPSPLVPVFLIRPPYESIIAIRSYHKDNNNNFDRIDLVSPDDGVSVDWKCYRENKTASNETYGFRVFNPSHELCFDSGKHYFKIHSVHSFTLEPQYHFGELYHKEISHPDILDPYYILTPSSFCFFTSHDSGAPGKTFVAYFTMGLTKVSSTSVNVTWLPFLAEVWNIWANLTYCVNNTVKLIVCRP